MGGIEWGLAGGCSEVIEGQFLRVPALVVSSRVGLGAAPFIRRVGF